MGLVCERVCVCVHVCALHLRNFPGGAGHQVRNRRGFACVTLCMGAWDSGSFTEMETHDRGPIPKNLILEAQASTCRCSCQNSQS